MLLSYFFFMHLWLTMPCFYFPRVKIAVFCREAKALSDYELLAIFLRTGIKDCPVMSLSKNVLTHFVSFHALVSADKKAFVL